MLRRCVVFVLLFVTIQGIYDPSDEVVEKPTKTVHFHHNYSKVNVQRPIYNAHSYGQRPLTTHQEIERLTQNGDLVRIKRNRTKIEIYSKCPKGATGQFVFELSCNQYLNCWKGRGFVQNCAPGTLFNPKTLECDYAEKVQCVTGPRQSILLHHHEKLTEETQPGCPEGFSGIIPHYTDCSKFINCDRGKENVMDCAPGTLFDVNSNNCDYPHKALCVNQQYGQSGRDANAHGQRYSISSGSNQASANDYQKGTYDPNVYGTQGGRYIASQEIRDNHQGSSNDQNQQNYNFGASASGGHQGQMYKPVHNVGVGYQSNTDDFGQNLGSYDQHLDSSSANSRGRHGHGYRPVHSVRTTYQDPSYGSGQTQYHDNLDSYNQNRESSFASGQNTFGQKGQRYKPVYVNQPPSDDQGQGHYDQNLETYDQNVESSSPHWLRNPSRQYRPVYNVTTAYLEQGQYDQNLDATSDTFNADTHRAPRYRPINNGGTASNTNNYDHSYAPTSSNVRRGNSQSQDSESFTSYARGHQINAYRPSQNVKTGYQASSYEDQEQQSSRLNQGVYSQNQQLSSTSNVHDDAYQGHQTSSHGQAQSPKCPEGGAGLYAHPYDCSKFLNCANGITYIQDCAPGTLFNPLLKVCDFPYNVACSNGNRRVSSNQENSSNIGNDGQQEYTGGISAASSSTRRTPVNFYTSQRPHTNIDRHQQGFYNQQNRNYQHRPVQNWQEDGDNVPYSSTRRPIGFYPSKRPQSNIDRHEQSVYDQQNKNYQHRPVQNWQEGNDNVPSSSTRRPVIYLTSNRPQSNIDRYEQTVYDQQNKNYEHRPARQWNTVDSSSEPQTQQSLDREQGVIEQKTLYDGHQQGWIPVEADAFPISTNKPNGFYVTKPPQNHLTPKPADYERTYETPEVDYVYEYDDDIIVDTQPASSNKKPQSIVCRGGQYTCPHNKCITNLAICDSFHDCVDGSDESNCDLDKFASTKSNKLAVAEKKKIANTTAVGCAKYCLDEIGFECRAFNYRKHDGVCYLLDRNIGLSGALIIYPIFDYYEMSSKTINCTSLFHCPNNKCVPYSKLCDGQNDCGDRTDEKHCSAHVLGYSIRLTGSPNKNEGRIEVTALGKTGLVCDDNFGLRDAEVVCRELGFELGALEVKGNSYYAKEIGNNTFYLMDDVGCLGNESTLRDCDFNGWGVHNCMGQEVVGVVCKTPEEKCKEGFWQCDNEQECIPVGFLCDGVFDCTDNSDEEDGHCNAPIQLRLANGSTHLEGRVEIKYLDTWGTICDDDFNEDAAKVVCQYFGFQGAASVRKNGYYGPGKGPIWLDQVFCQGNESSLQDCVYWDWGEHNCDHSEDVGVVCSESAYVDGTERRRKEQVVEPPRVEPLQLLPERCGFRKDSIFTQDDEVHFRVVKGSEAKKGDYPWQASIRVKGKSKPTHWCGAVVISQRFVLTAAHCLQGFSKSAYIVVAGDYHVDEDEGSEQVALIEDFYLHEDFRKGQKMNNDIALVKLKGNGFRITDDVQPICLPDSTTSYQNDMNCTISGFGSTKSGKAFYSHALRAGWIPLQSREICKMPHIYGSSITEGMICAGFLDEGVDACDGDSGGPLACLYEGVFTLFGITSWGQHCGYANKPGVYVKVGYYREWIEEKMRKYA